MQCGRDRAEHPTWVRDLLGNVRIVTICCSALTADGAEPEDRGGGAHQQSLSGQTGGLEGLWVSDELGLVQGCLQPSIPSRAVQGSSQLQRSWWAELLPLGMLRRET